MLKPMPLKPIRVQLELDCIRLRGDIVASASGSDRGTGPWLAPSDAAHPAKFPLASPLPTAKLALCAGSGGAGRRDIEHNPLCRIPRS